MTNEGSDIKNHKKRGEWAELQFMARAAEHGLSISKPWGESEQLRHRSGKQRAISVGPGEVHHPSSREWAVLFLQRADLRLPPPLPL